MVPRYTDESEYEEICRKNKKELRALGASVKNRTWKAGAPPSLPSYPGANFSYSGLSLINFDEEWIPTVTRIRRQHSGITWESFFALLVPGLRPAFIQLAAYEERTGKYWS